MKKLSLAGATVSALLSCGALDMPALSAASSWKVLPICGGGYVQNVLISPSDPNVWYTYVDVGGPYRSDDAGRHWRPLHGNFPALHRDNAGDCIRTMSVDPRNADSFVFVSGGSFRSCEGIFVSRDGGKTFRQSGCGRFYGNGPRRMTGLCLARDPSDPDLLLAGEDWDGIVRSTDNGENWTPVNALEHTWITDIRFDATVKGRVYVCAMPPPRATREGDAWKLEGRTYGAGFFRSDDGGLTWRKLSGSTPDEVCQIAGDTALVGYFDAEREVRRSLDGGLTWEPFAEGLPAYDDSRAGWSTAVGNFIAFGTGPDFWLAGDASGRIFRRGRGDAAWTEVRHDSTRAGAPEREPRMQFITNGKFDALCSLIVDPRDPTHWLATDWYEIWETTDAGRNWTTRIDGIMQLVSFTIECDPFSVSNITYGVADKGLFMSPDGGRRYYSPNGWIYACSASYSRQTRGLVMSCGGKGPGMIRRSRSAGRWWEKPALRGLPTLEGDNPRIRAYTIAANPTKEEFLVCLSGPVGKGKGGIYRTANGGDDWEWYGEGLPAGQDLFKEGEWGKGGPFPQLYFGVDGSAVCHSAKAWKSWYLDREAGVWRPCDRVVGIVAADPFRPGRFLTNGRPIHESLDGGRTFHPYDANVNGCSFISFDAHVRDLVVIGTADRNVMVSRDGGRHFAPLPDGDRVPSGCSSKVLVDRKRLFYLSTGSGVFTRTIE